MPQEIEHWSLTTLRKELIKIRSKGVRHGRYVTFQMAEVAVRNLLREILRRADYQNQAIRWLRKGCSSLGGGTVVQFPRSWMSSG